MSGDTSNIPGLDSILRGEIMRKDALINQLVNQNKEMLSTKERQDIELSAQRETLQVYFVTSNQVVKISMIEGTKNTYRRIGFGSFQCSVKRAEIGRRGQTKRSVRCTGQRDDKKSGTTSGKG